MELRTHLEPNPWRHPALLQAVQPLRIFNSDGSGRYLSDTLPIAERPGMRSIETGRCHRAHQSRHRTELGRVARPPDPIAHRLPVGRKGHVEQHDLAFDSSSPQGGQVLTGRHHHDVGFNALGRGPDAHAEAEHRQRLRARSDQLEGFFSTDPLRHLDGLPIDSDALRVPHLARRPLDGLVELRTAGDPRTDLIAERAEQVPASL